MIVRMLNALMLLILAAVFLSASAVSFIDQHWIACPVFALAGCVYLWATLAEVRGLHAPRD